MPARLRVSLLIPEVKARAIDARTATPRAFPRPGCSAPLQRHRTFVMVLYDSDLAHLGQAIHNGLYQPIAS